MSDPNPGDLVLVTFQTRYGSAAWKVTKDNATKVEVIEPTDDPSKDPIGTVRVRPNDDPKDISADRRIKLVAYAPYAGQWYAMSRPESPTFQDAGVTGWPKQSLADVARIFGHEQPTAQPKLRVFRDDDKDLWYEMKPDSFAYGFNREDAGKNHLSVTLQQLRDDFKNLIEVTE